MTDDNEVEIAARSKGCAICLSFAQLFSDHRHTFGGKSNTVICVVAINNVTDSATVKFGKSETWQKRESIQKSNKTFFMLAEKRF